MQRPEWTQQCAAKLAAVSAQACSVVAVLQAAGWVHLGRGPRGSWQCTLPDVHPCPQAGAALALTVGSAAPVLANEFDLMQVRILHRAQIREVAQPRKLQGLAEPERLSGRSC